MEEKSVFNKKYVRRNLNNLGYNDLEILESMEQSAFEDNESRLYLKNEDSDTATIKSTPISLCDHKKIVTLLNSKLLFLEDVQFVELVLSHCYTCNESSKKYMHGAVATSIISVAACLNRSLDLYLPLSCVAMTSIYAAWQFYQDVNEANTNKVFTLYVETLQNMCINFHKLLRFIKEVEILSTGQISTENVGSAMYKPLNSVIELNELPPWKTLPNLRKSVADSLINVITIFSRSCDDMKKFTATWMHIKGFSLGSQVSLNEIESISESIKGCDGCISMKVLQLLNENYLLVQSEFLKWAAFYLCPVVWNDSNITFSSYKTEIVTVFENTEKKFRNICLKLHLSFNFETIFNFSETSYTNLKIYPKNETSSEELNDFKNLQKQLHNIFFLVLNTVKKAKGLEDYFESVASQSNEENDLRENLTKQLGVIRSDLEQVIKNYDYICSFFHDKKKLDHADVNEDNESIASPSSMYQPRDFSEDQRIRVGYSDFAVNSPDEVFLAISGSKPEDFEVDLSDWCLEKKPKIPPSLIVELSTTLKPIKKDFEARERVAMERLGVQDIENSESEDGENEMPISSQINNFKPKKVSSNQLELNHGNDEISNGNMSDLQTDNSLQNKSVSAAHSLRIADLLLTSSIVQQRKNLQEDCFSND